MKSVRVVDGTIIVDVLVREDVDLPDLPKGAGEPAHTTFIRWWREECDKRNIPYDGSVANAQGIRIIKRLLHDHTLAELKELGSNMMFDYGADLKDDPNHFVLFAKKVEVMKGQLDERG